MQCIECGSIWDLQDERCYDCNSKIDWSANVATFEAGRTYATRSACDHECIFRYTVTRRTDKSVWIREAGKHASDEVKRRAIEVWNGSEMIYPTGKYSMCPIIRAENVEPDQKGNATNNNVHICCWTRTDNDHRDVAGGVASALVPQRVAKRLAVAIDSTGNAGAGEYLPRFNLKDGHRLAVGHGVTVKYRSGDASFTKTYRQYD